MTGADVRVGNYRYLLNQQTLLKLFKFGFHFTGAEAFILILGMVVAFVVSLFVIKFLMGYIKKHNFIVFGWYRIVLGVIVLGCGIAGLL